MVAPSPPHAFPHRFMLLDKESPTATVLSEAPVPQVTRHEVPRWHTEMPYFTLALIVALPIWALLVFSIVGVIYAAMFAAFFLFTHALFVGHVRANGVRLGPDQMPALYDRVCAIAEEQGLDVVPDAYLMQAGGLLNAFATKFLGRRMIVLYSELLEACGSDTAARDMIIGHELGHIRAGHLTWNWLIAPGLIVPFLGGALSRAREYTCDRYGLAAAGHQHGAELGLTILAVGGRLAKHVNRQAFLDQKEELRGFWMWIAQLMSTHPPLMTRIAAIEQYVEYRS